jgi:peptide/nickel transport system permease protein
VIAYAVRRLLRIPGVLLATFVLAFALVRAAPRVQDAALLEGLDGCDRDTPFLSLLVRALVRWAQLDVDPCTGRAQDGLPVVSHLANAVAPTLTLAGGALVFALLLAVVAGAALARGGHRAQRLSTLGLAVLEAVPAFVIAPSLLWLFGLSLRVAPSAHPSGAGLALPVMALGLAFGAAQARAVRDVLRAPASVAFRTAALSRGQSATRVRLTAVRLAALPVLGALGATSSALVMSAIAVEMVFSIPGLGSLAVRAATAGDVNVLFGAALAYALMLLLASAFFDVAYAALDPRVRGAR